MMRAFSFRAARRAEIEGEIASLLNAIAVLEYQREVAIAAGLPLDHLYELDDEEAGYRARIEAIGGMVSQ